MTRIKGDDIGIIQADIVDEVPLKTVLRLSIVTPKALNRESRDRKI